MSDEREKRRRWLAGESIPELAFRYNSAVDVLLPSGERKLGWVVAAEMEGGTTRYTVEAGDGSGDIECLESALREVDAT
jgi:hypothetical protein